MTPTPHRTAVVVPFRRRMENLESFLAYMHPFLMKQAIEYKVYVISQVMEDTVSKSDIRDIKKCFFF